ncbi:unnamed protein product [Trichobilharzia szidati]|nr:unnamed protein product [Trichobilharzia szidati]
MGNCFGFRSETSYLLDQEVYETHDEQDEIPRAEHPMPTYHISPGLPILASDLTEEEQIQIVKRIHMLQFLPLTNYVPVNKEKLRECIICMNDLKLGDEVRYLPCLHTYHRVCIDEWLMRSFSCPTCLLNLEPDNSAATRTQAENPPPPPPPPAAPLVVQASSPRENVPDLITSLAAGEDVVHSSSVNDSHSNIN